MNTFTNSVNPHQITVLLLKFYFFLNLKFMFLIHVYIVVQFYPWFKFYFLLFLGIVMYDNEFETEENIISTKDKIEPQHKHDSLFFRHQNILLHVIRKDATFCFFS